MADADSTRPTRSRLLELFDYDREAGRLTPKPKPRINRQGYRFVKVEKKSIPEHHVIWFLEKGRWPKGVIDHINGNPGDNRIENLRDVTQRVNVQNQRYAQVSNKSTGMLGVSMRKNGKFDARIQHKGRNLYIGCFDTAEDAHAAYVRAKRALHEGCTI